ncbi:MAG: hypothetical protein U0U70_05635 [Chitinophagaceae bacterium]
MKSTILKFAFFGVAAAGFILASCTKGADSRLTTQTDLTNKTQIRVVVATVNASRNYVYVDGSPLNGASLTSGSVFPSSGVYAASIDPGVKNFLVRDTLTAATQIPLSFAENMQPAHNYTVFLYDTINAPKQRTVETKYEIPADHSCRLRFANFIYNASAVPNIDVFSVIKNANVFTNVPVTGVTDFIPYPINTAPDTLYIRETGTLTNVVSVPVGSTTFNDKRSYTLLYRGSYKGTKATTLYTDR